MILRPVLLATVACAGFATAQRAPLPGIPLVPPPVNHPALAAQPLMQPDTATRPAPAPAPVPAGPAAKKAEQKPPTIDPDTVGVKASGSALKQRVARVLALKWGTDRADLEALSAATGKPILYLQALGTLEGFA